MMKALIFIVSTKYPSLFIYKKFKSGSKWVTIVFGESGRVGTGTSLYLIHSPFGVVYRNIKTKSFVHFIIKITYFFRTRICKYYEF